MQSQKWQNDLVHFQSKPFNMTVIQVYGPTTNAEEAEVERFYEDLQDLIELKPPKKKKKRCPFHNKGLEWKSRKSRDTWSNKQVWPWSTKWSRAKSNRVLPRERIDHSKHSLPTTQDKTLQMDIIIWSYQNQIDYILCSQRWRSSIQSAKTRLGVDCGSDHELLLQNSDVNWRK